MQIICPVNSSSEEYHYNRQQTLMRPPPCCPHCHRERSLRALGYYQRDVTRLERGTLRISVRRYRCVICRKTVSLLPEFAQPYRMVLNVTIEAYTSGRYCRPDVERWQQLLQRYWRRFCNWQPELFRIIEGIGLSPPFGDPAMCWHELLNWGGSLGEINIRLTTIYRVALFGRYRCHLPNTR